MAHPLPPQTLEFLELIRSWQHAYAYSTFTYVAINSGSKYALLRGRITLRAFPPVARCSRIGSKMFCADEVDLTVAQPEALEALAAAVASGEAFPLGQDSVTLLLGPTVQARHERPAQGEPSVLGYVSRLIIEGQSRWQLMNNLDIEFAQDLAAHGFRSVEELLDDYGFKLSSTDSLSVEVIAEPVAWIDRDSHLSGRTAHVKVSLSPNIATDTISLAIVGSPTGDRRNRVRQRVSSDQIAWQPTPQWAGHCTVELPHPVVARCRIMVNNVLHDEFPLIDALASANRRRALVQLADPDLTRLRGPIINPRDDEERKAFEAGIAILFYMLGFDSIRVGESKKLSAAADIFAMTASGEILIVECTTDALDPRGKLQKLMRRVDEARVALGGLWPDITENRITGVILVPRPAADLAELAQIARRGNVLLVAREQIEQALELTQFAPNADAVLARWREQPLFDVLTKGLDA